MRAVDWTEVEKQMQQARREMEAAKNEMGETASKLREELGNASKQLDEAESELRGYQELIYQLESDGLLDTHHDYQILWNEPELKINSNTQSPSIATKYQKFFKDNYTLITKKNGKMNVRKGKENH